MHKFRFRLENFLRIKKFSEREWELKLAAATGKCVTLQNRIRDLRDETQRHASCSVEGIMYSLEDLRIRGLYVRRLEKEIEAAEAELVLREEERRKVQEEYLKASRERKVLDKLKERREAEYYKRQLYEESKTLDEIGQTMGLRRGLDE
jgi:flagellar protein FliJ